MTLEKSEENGADKHEVFRIFYSPLAIMLEITKRKMFYMSYFNLNPSHI